MYHHHHTVACGPLAFPSSPGQTMGGEAGGGEPERRVESRHLHPYHRKWWKKKKTITIEVIITRDFRADDDLFRSTRGCV